MVLLTAVGNFFKAELFIVIICTKYSKYKKVKFGYLSTLNFESNFFNASGKRKLLYNIKIL